MRSLLELLKEDELWNAAAVDSNSMPGVTEAKNYVLSFLVHVLTDDLKCWMENASATRASPSTLLRQRDDVPLVARLFWPQGDSTIGYVNGNCRDLVRIHLDALVRNY